jgi:hypothetical protein
LAQFVTHGARNHLELDRIALDKEGETHRRRRHDAALGAAQPGRGWRLVRVRGQQAGLRIIVDIVVVSRIEAGFVACDRKQNGTLEAFERLDADQIVDTRRILEGRGWTQKRAAHPAIHPLALIREAHKTRSRAHPISGRGSWINQFVHGCKRATATANANEPQRTPPASGARR